MSGFFRRLVCISALVLPLSAGTASAQQNTGSVSVTVTESDTGEPVAAASVVLSRLGLGVLTNSSGHARLTGVAPGVHELEVRRLGYAPQHLSLSLAPSGNVSLQVELTLTPVALEGVEVDAPEARNEWLDARGFYDREKLGFGDFLTRDEIEKWGGASSDITSTLRRMRGMRLVMGSRGSGWVVTSPRSRCPADIYIDGIRISGQLIASGSPVAGGSRPSPASRAETSVGAVDQFGNTVRFEEEPIRVDQLVRADEIEALEWYSGSHSAPAQFSRPVRGNYTDCGTLLIWTRVGG